MSLGTPRYTFRLPKKLMDMVQATIDLRNANTRDFPWDLSEFVRVALIEKVAKMNRSRKRPIEESYTSIHAVAQDLRVAAHQPEVSDASAGESV